MKRDSIGVFIQKYIDARIKTEQISLQDIMKILEDWRYEVIFNTMSLYILCEKCGQGWKKCPDKWMDRMSEPYSIKKRKRERK